MSNVLSEDKRQQVLALGRLGWSLRRIEQATGIRRETASSYLKAAGLAVRPARKWGREPAEQAKPAKQGITDPAKPGNQGITDFGADCRESKPREAGSG